MTFSAAKRYDNIETKCVRVKDGRGTAHTLKLDRFNAEMSTVMGDAGFGSYNIQYTICDGGQMEAHYDPYKLKQEGMMMGMNEAAEELIKALHSSEILWGQIHHDDTLLPEDIEKLKDGTR